MLPVLPLCTGMGGMLQSSSGRSCVVGDRRFKELVWTVHSLAPGESQGKASNVNYGVRQGLQYFTKSGNAHLCCHSAGGNIETDK